MLHTGDSFNIGHIQIPAGGQGTKECSNICSTLEALGRLLVTLTVINLQIYH